MMGKEFDYKNINKYKDIWCLEGEVWKKLYKVPYNNDELNLDGKYEVSSLGRVRSILCTVSRKGVRNNMRKNNKILHQYKDCGGYYRVAILGHSISVHRLVALGFIKNLNNGKYVNHIDENRLNNNYLNLEWCTARYNNNYGTHNDKISKWSKEYHAMFGKAILQYDLNGNFIKKYNNMSEIYKSSSIPNKKESAIRTNIYCCLSGKQKSAYGYIWRYEADDAKEGLRTVIQYDKNMNKIEEFSSCAEALKHLNKKGSAQAIYKCCKHEIASAYGFIWRYSTDLDKSNPYKHRDLKAVFRYSLDMKYIDQFKSATEAAKILGYNRNTICNCCNHIQQTAYGYVWRYIEDVKPPVIAETKKPVVQYTEDMQLIKEFDSLTQAERESDCNATSISNCCKGKQKTAGKFIWRFKNSDVPLTRVNYTTKKVRQATREVCQFDLNMKLIKKYDSISDAAKTLDVNNFRNIISGIIDCCKKRHKESYGFIWRYANDLESED